jgi:hypothetical protein
VIHVWDDEKLRKDETPLKRNQDQEEGSSSRKRQLSETLINFRYRKSLANSLVPNFSK